ncbi:MAG: BatD family protein [Bacteroidota bacterium]|nr:BatD family protein [Bacteroidota bacterium]
MKQKIVVFAAFLFLTFHAIGAQVRFRMSGPDIVSIGDQFRLSFILNAEGRDLKLPNLDDFDLLMGPSVSSSSSTVIINGQVTQSSEYSYTYILRAKKIGKFSIRPATVNIGGKTVPSNGIQIQVIKGSTGNRSQQQSGNDDQSAQRASFGKVGKNDLFVRMNVDKNTVYKGQHVVATMKIYTRVNVAGFNDVHFPTFDGFWNQDVEMPQQISMTREVVNGQVYNVGILKKTVLFPQKTGKILIKPFDIECIVQQHSAPRNIFDDFFGSVRNVKTKVASNSATINVKPLPTPPADFSGGVGSLQMSASLDKSSVPANEAATLKINISGNGNLKLIEPLKINFPSGFESYDPKTNMNIKSSAGGVYGNISFDYLFIPRNEGQFTIPAISFIFFNPSNGQYERRTAGPFSLKVTKSTGGGATLVGNYSQQDLKLLGQDIRYIKTSENIQPKGQTLYSSTWFYLLFLLAVLAFTATVALNRKRARENANLELMRHRKASKVARKNLRNASIQLKANNKEQFYEAVLKAFWGYLSDKLSIPVADLNRETAVESLRQQQISDDLVKEFLDIVDNCEFARYAPAELTGPMNDVYKKAEKVMNELDHQISKK